jgi:ubiquinone/menaquinone biosynthesis C-methylase UbiE
MKTAQCGITITIQEVVAVVFAMIGIFQWSSIFFLYFHYGILSCCEGLSSIPPPPSRRDLLVKAPLGAVLTYSYGRGLYNAFQNLGLKHPEEHERHVRSTIKTTLMAAAPSIGHTMRILEVGIGSDCRLLRRMLYLEAFQSIAKQGVTKVELVGIDLKPPDEKTIEVTRQALNAYNSGVDVSLQIVEQSITQPLSFPEKYFDAILCCLTLCSVDDPAKAVQEMHRVLRSNGGALGYVEHVAASEYDFLEKQQVLLDPFQQQVADNCHLHRYTEQILQDNLLDSSLIQEERFLVNAMWPVSMQACGVFQRS